MYSILVVGAGYVGREIAQHFRAKDQKVTALTRTDRNKTFFQAQGIQHIIADLTQPETLEQIPPAHFIVICPAPDQRTPEAYRAVYLDGVRNVLQAVQKNPKPYLMVYLSSTGVWEDTQGEWIDEAEPANAQSDRGKILREAEELVLNSGLPATILRLAGIYGPERNRIQKAQGGQWEAPEKDRYLNLIHRDDIVAAIPKLFKSAEEGKIYVGVDDQPVLFSELYAWIHKELGQEKQASFTTDEVAGKRCYNTSLKALGFEFQFPTYREGYASLLTSSGLKKSSK